jgi:hypothetical protein
MARRSKPINADVPLSGPPIEATPQTEAPPRGEKPPRSATTPAEPPTEELSVTAGAAGQAREPGAPAAAPVEKAPAAAPPPPPPRTGHRRSIPAALKAIGGLVVIAIVFIVAAIVGGGGNDGGGIPGAAPTPEQEQTQPSPEPGPAQPGPTSGPDELGYPEFATNNTTRIGGPDPASNAAAVALAVYPSAEPAQRPHTVTFVNADDWQTAIASSVLMGDPVRAPLLVSEAGQLPDASAESFDALDPAGSRATKGAQAFAIAGAAVPSAVQATDVPATGAAGAAAIAALRERLAGAPPRHMVVAPSDPAFAMPAAAWAARSGDPVLYSEPNSLPKPTAQALERHPKVPVFVLGPSSQISSEVVRQIAKIDKRVRRVSGEDPIANAIALARYRAGSFGWNVNDPGHGFVVARSDSPLDAVAAAPLSASGTWGPLLLSDSADTLPRPVREYLLDVKPGYTTDPTRAFYNHVWVIGDSDAIGVAEQAEIDELAELAKIGEHP